MPHPRDWTLLHAHVHQTLRKRKVLPSGQSLLIAVSGGQDSLCLLRLLMDLQPKWGWRLAIAHCNHRWRSDADANATHVQVLAEAYQLPYYSAIATEGMTSEAAARAWRYRVLTELAIAHDIAYVVTGHTASDRAETLLYNLMRGSGLDGLQALTWQRSLAPNVQLVRPLLEVTRAEITAFCQTAELMIWEDSTNQDLRYARNRIRQELLPYLAKHFNPQVEELLAQTAELLRSDMTFLEAAAANLWRQAVLLAEQDLSQPTDLKQQCTWMLNRKVLRIEPLAMQRRVLHRFLKEGLQIAPTFDQVEKLLALLVAPNRSQTDPFPGGAIARVQADWIVLDQQPLGKDCDDEKRSQ